MKVPIYRSTTELTQRSGSVRNPGVAVPFSLAAAQAQSAQSLAKGFNDVASWALKKQELHDKTQATLGESDYKSRLDALSNSILNPRDEVNDTLGINLFQMSPKQREGMWALAKKTLRTDIANKYGASIGGRTARASFSLGLDNADTVANNAFVAVINKRVVQQSVAASFKRRDDRVKELSNPYLPLNERQQIMDEQIRDDLRTVNGGLQTAAQVDAQKEKFRVSILANVVDQVAQSNTNDRGVIKRAWLKNLRDNPGAALGENTNAAATWNAATIEERRDMLDELDKARNRQLDTAQAQDKAKETENDELVSTTMHSVFQATPGSEAAIAAFVELSAVMKQNPSTFNNTQLEQAKKHAFTTDSNRFGSNDEFLRLTSLMRNFEIGEDGQPVSVVTTSKIINSDLNANQKSLLLGALQTAKDWRVREANRLIKNAAGLVSGVEDTLSDDDSQQVMTVIANAERRMTEWFNLNASSTQAEIFNKGQELADEVRGQVGVLYVGAYDDAVKKASLNLAFAPIYNASEITSDGKQNITRLFNDALRDKVLNKIMKGPKNQNVKYDALWRRMQINRINVLRTLAIQANIEGAAQ